MKEQHHICLLTKRRLVLFLTTVMGIASVSGITCSNANAQLTEKNISIFPTKTFLFYPIEITQVRIGDDTRKMKIERVGDLSLRPSENFNELPDWLGRTSFQIENVSEKRIVYLSMNLLFPETTSNGAIMTFPVTFGRRPGSKLQSSNPVFSISPNETLEIPLNS